ncbi:MAG TPA: dephospho-CoA kinase, partial [Pyrinomonadaceae bacterium]|nr:dephospho-CoA kinase [Pyrinomonadaceae bacterium]
MLRVGLTGSIAVGKSFVTSIFSDLGCHTLDADVTAREVVLPGSAGLAAVAEAFGSDILNPDGSLNRQH